MAKFKHWEQSNKSKLQSPRISEQIMFGYACCASVQNLLSFSSATENIINA